jgi:hypothetical protein
MVWGAIAAAIPAVIGAFKKDKSEKSEESKEVKKPEESSESSRSEESSKSETETEVDTSGKSGYKTAVNGFVELLDKIEDAFGKESKEYKLLAKSAVKDVAKQSNLDLES